MKTQPPKFARKVFEWLAGPANVDDLLGDIEEWFYINLKTKSVFKAKLFYWKQILSIAFSYALRKRRRDAKNGVFSSPILSIDMLQNYFKVAVRNLYHYRYFAFLNAFGLAIGMSVSLLIIALYSHVSTYDNFHINGERVYTIESTYRDGVEEIDYATAPLTLADKISNEFTGTERVLQIVRNNVEVKTLNGEIPVKTYFTQPEFFDVFSFQITRGNAAILAEPNNIIVTESTAIKLFNSVDVIGKSVELQTGPTLTIGAIMKDPPNNTHLSFDMLASLSTLPEKKIAIADQWTNYNSEYIYVLLKEDVNQEQLQQYLDNVSLETYNASPVKVEFGLQHLDDITMGPDSRQAIGIKWDSTSLFIFGFFAALILLPACFNYTNISIARALRRAKEIGLRKTLGGVRKQIFMQFLTETIIMGLIALVGALLIFILIRSEFQSMLVAGGLLDLSLSVKMVALFFAFAIFTGAVAGIFPAVYFAGLNPIEALKNKIAKGSSMRIRKGLTIFQFALSFGFILTMVVVVKQYRYSINYDFGFEKENVVNVPLQGVDAASFKTQFSSLAPVQSVSMSSGLLGVGASRTWIHNDANDSSEVAQLFVDRDYVDNLGFTFLAGKNFPDGVWHREQFLIVNEEFVKAHGFTNASDALGRIYKVDGRDLEVIGVVKNFHYDPLQVPIKDFFFRNNPSKLTLANLKVVSTDAYTMFTAFENAWKVLSPETKFTGRFFESELNEAYSTYNTLLKIVGFLGATAITISILGMLGMVVYTAESRTKEVSIRKVMGASVFNIAYLLSKDYLKLLSLSILIAIPIAGFVLNTFMHQIQYYSVSLSVWDILISSVILLTLGLSTITSQTYRTAITNPAETLKGE